MELWDVVDQEGHPQGRTMVRGAPFGPGDYHAVVNVWIQDEAGMWLIQRRTAHVETDPLIWATTAGSVLAGERIMDAVVREAYKEIGSRFNKGRLKPVYRRSRNNTVNYIWLLRVNRAELQDCKIGPDVAEVKWVSSANLATMVSDGEFYDYGTDYFAQLGVR